MISIPLRRKAKYTDYVSVETSTNEFYTHLNDVSTQTTIAGHRDPCTLQIYNPPRDRVSKRNINATERNRRRNKGRKSQEKKLDGNPEEQEEVDDSYEDGETSADENDHDTKDYDHDNTDYNDNGPKEDVGLIQIHGGAKEYVTAAISVATTPVPALEVSASSTESGQAMKQLLTALKDADKVWNNLEKAQGLLRYQIGLANRRRDLLEELDRAIVSLRRVTAFLPERRNTKQECASRDLKAERMYYIGEIDRIRAQLAVFDY